MKRYLNKEAVAALRTHYPQAAQRAKLQTELMLGGGQDHYVDMITDEVLILLWKADMAGKMPADPVEWARKRAHRHAKYMLERQAAKERLAASVGLPSNPQSEAVTPAGKNLANAFRALFAVLEMYKAAASMKLTTEERMVAELVCQRHMSQVDAAFELNMSLRQVRLVWANLLKKITGQMRTETSTDHSVEALLQLLLKNPQPSLGRLGDLLRLVASQVLAEVKQAVRQVLGS